MSNLFIYIIMKKATLFLSMLLVAVFAVASNPMKQITGRENLKAIMSSDAKAFVVYDWTDAKYDKTKDLKKELADDYDFVIPDCEKSFVKGFNNKSKHLKLSTDSSDAKYKFVLKVTSIDRYFQPMTFIPKHEGKMWGSLEIFDVETNKSLTKITIDEAEEGYDLVPKECFGKTFLNLGEKVAKLK